MRAKYYYSQYILPKNNPHPFYWNSIIQNLVQLKQYQRPPAHSRTTGWLPNVKKISVLKTKQVYIIPPH